MQISGIILLAVIGVIIVFSAQNSAVETESKNANIPIHDSDELAVHKDTSDDLITVKINQATIVIDEKTPNSCVMGYCSDDRKPGKYVLRVDFEVSNLSNDQYIHAETKMKVEDKNGKLYEPASRSIGIAVKELSKGKSLTDSLLYDVDVPLSEYFFIVEPIAFYDGTRTKISLNDIQVIRPSLCQGTADCFAGTITKIIDGDTLDIKNIETNEIQRIRLSLTDTPEKNEKQFDTATEFTAGFCPVDSYVLFDEDDGQKEGSYERIIGKLYCEGNLLNDILLQHDLAVIDKRFCEKSEYGSEQWAIDYGCNA